MIKSMMLQLSTFSNTSKSFRQEADHGLWGSAGTNWGLMSGDTFRLKCPGNARIPMQVYKSVERL